MDKIALTLTDEAGTSITLEGFELPEHLPFGGDQALVVHKYPGGLRQMDAMGRDDVEIFWEGRFRGSVALGRALYLDYLRTSGQTVILSCGPFAYTVVVKSFYGRFENAGLEIPYSITLLVLEDLASPITEPPDTPEAAADSDFSQVLGLAVSGLSAAMNAVSTARNLYKAVKSGNPVALLSGGAMVAGYVGASAQTLTAGTALADYGAAVNEAAGVARQGIGAVQGVQTLFQPGASPATMASGLLSTMSALSGAAQSSQAAALLGRMGRNLDLLRDGSGATLSSGG